jgi:predicted amidohydrolase YtcJ
VATLAALVAGRSAGGAPPPQWFRDQLVDVDAALRSMSAAPAFAAFQEKDLGQLTVGRYADFTVLSADPYAADPEALASLTIRMTVVGGRVTYDASRPAGAPE